MTDTGQPFDPARHLTNLKGKDYLEVKWRLVWFRDVHKTGGHITTELVESSDDHAIFRATVTVANEDGISVASATGYGSETKRDFGDYIEKAETKAVGRALGMLGFGTQFAPEFDEGDRIVDSPVQPSRAASPSTSGGHGGGDRPPSEKQVWLFKKLVEETGIAPAQLRQDMGWPAGLRTEDLTGRQCSDAIEYLKGLPK